MNRPLNDATRRRMSTVATIAALAFTVIIGFSLVGLSIWGFWICQGFANSPDDRMLGAHASTFVTLRLVLSWLVLFGPVAFTGVFVLRSTWKQAFGKNDESWVYPFRVFMAVVGMKMAVERQEKGERLPAEGEKLLEGVIEPKK
jgi:hypothetical protein